MDKNLLWSAFMETGDIEIYIKYKEAEGREMAVEADGDQRNDNQGS